MAELDLDSFLNSSSSEDDDEVDHHRDRRTVDDILLNDSDSDDNLSQLKYSDSSDVSIPTPLPLSSQIPKPPISLSTARLGDPFSSFGRRVSRPPLPALFGSVRTNAKPGAALAAAAAASRTAPTPHAAAIKSRRASLISNNGIDQEAAAAVEFPSNSNEVSESDVVSDNLEEYSSEVESSADVLINSLELATDRLDDRDSEFGHFKDSASLDISESFLEETEIIRDRDVNVGTDDDRDSESHNNLKADIASTSLVDDGPKRNLESDMPIVEDHETFELDFGDEISMGGLGEECGEVKGEGFSRDGDFSEARNEINELVEDMIAQWESKRGSKKDVKNSRTNLKPLQLAEALEKKHASTGLHWEEGAAAQPMRLEGVRRGSIALGYLDIDADNTITRVISSQAFRRDHGSPQVLAVHLNYIAVGMSKGIVVVVPSRYSAHHVDNMDGKMLLLGIQGEKSNVPVTSMCFTQQGDMLLAGYGDGHVTVWDVQKASAAKVITGEHSAPVVHAFFLGQDSQVTRQFKAVTGDSKGLVLLHTFSLVPVLNMFTIKTQCLLDGQQTGTVLAASPLLSDEVFGGSLMSSQGNSMVPTSSIGSMIGGVVGGDAARKLFSEGPTLVEEGVVIFVTHQTALVVRLSPTLEVYTKLSKPEGVREGSMPFAAWKCVAQSRGPSADSGARVSLLAIAWDRKVQVAKLIKAELKVYGKWTLDSAALGMAWLDDQVHALI